MEIKDSKFGSILKCRIIHAIEIFTELVQTSNFRKQELNE